MTQRSSDFRPFVFPAWANLIPGLVGLGALSAIFGTIFAFWYWGTAKHLDVGYQPTQPVPYSHQLHVGQLGMDCRYCHVNVERSTVASVPPTQVCMNCHASVKKDSPKLQPVRDSWASGKPVPWIRIHKAPDYVYFDHSRHVTSGVGCVSCHGRIDTMEVVKQVEPLSMGWCLDCHRNPAPNLRPTDAITKMDWQPPAGETAEAFGKKLVEKNHIQPPLDCSRCHR